ncbi:hypothetical protein BX600DRAFT_514792 [Xylariales sp. PMI_506]|nr:hypothetical protein BX600DRAFT_514792 [Xylariales sp. PMI_506]
MSSIDEQCQEEPSTQTLEPPWDPYYWRLVYGSSPSDYTMESMSYGSPTIECGGYDGFTPHTIADGGADQLPYPTGTTAKDDLVCLPSPLHLVGNNAENPIVIFGGEEIKPMSVPFRRGYSTGHAFAEQWRRNRSARNLTSNPRHSLWWARAPRVLLNQIRDHHNTDNFYSLPYSHCIQGYMAVSPDFTNIPSSTRLLRSCTVSPQGYHMEVIELQSRRIPRIEVA